MCFLHRSYALVLISSSISCEGNVINSLDNSNPARMLLEAIEAAGIQKVKDDFYLTLVQNGHVRIALLLIDTSCVELFYRQSRFFGSLLGTQAEAQYPSSPMQHQPRGPWCRYEVDGSSSTSINVI